MTNVSDMFVALEGVSSANDAIAYVGRLFARELTETLKEYTGGEPLDAQGIGEALVELKSRIGGGFYVVAVEPDRILMRNKQCPFGARVVGRPHLCTMTQEVFRKVAKDQTGYSHVTIDKAIARGDRQCEVSVYLTQAAKLRAESGAESDIAV